VFRYGGKMQKKLVSILGDSISTSKARDAVEFTIYKCDVSCLLKCYPTLFDVGERIGGKTITIDMVGHEIEFIPTKKDINKSIGKPREVPELWQKIVWWDIVIKQLRLKLLQNASWVGARICTEEQDIYKTAQAWHPAQIRKLSGRDRNGKRVAPDIIIIFRGVNDFSHESFSRITSFDPLLNKIPEDDRLTNGGYGFKEAYSLTIKKCNMEYPKAKIALCTCYYVNRQNGVNTLDEYNAAIREIANKMQCFLIDFDKIGLSYNNIDEFTIDGTHPNLKGHRLLGDTATKKLLPVLQEANL
jgi:lysophospholipase L1-like esterase